MPDDEKTSQEWSLDAVVRRLTDAVAAGHPASAQVFMTDDVDVNDVMRTAEEIVANARERFGLDGDSVRIVRIHRIAKSFSLITDRPEVIEAIARRHEVKAMLENKQTDIAPKPKR